MLRETLTDTDTGEVIAREGERVTAGDASGDSQAKPRHCICGSVCLNRCGISFG